MGQVLHGSARTTAAIRRAIQDSQESLRTLAKRHGINPKTVAKSGEAAARMLIALKSKGVKADVETSQCLPYELVVRQSTAPTTTS